MIRVGDIVRLVQTRGHVTKADAGMLVTVRAIGDLEAETFAVRVDDGDPANPDINTNGFKTAIWVPLKAIEPLVQK